MLTSVCEICNKQFIHTPRTKGRFCSPECSSNGIAIRRQQAITQYLLTPKQCGECGLALPYEKRHNTFCNSSCAAQSNMKKRYAGDYTLSDAARLRISATLANTRQRKGLYACAPYERVEFVVCKECGKPFVSHRTGKKYHRQQWCSNECRAAHRSRVARSNPGLGTKRSKQEIVLYELCSNYFNHVTNNEKLVDGWDADIIIHDIKVAILWNGPWHYREMNIGNHSLTQVQNRDRIKIQLFTQLGWQVLVFEDRYYTPQQAFASIQEYTNLSVSGQIS